MPAGPYPYYHQPQPRWTAGKILVVIVAAMLLGCGGLFALGAWYFGSVSSPTTQPPPQGTYSAALTCRSWSVEHTWQGQFPTRAYWMVVNLTLQNTGTLGLALDRLDWELADLDGFRIAFPANQFYSDVVVPPGQPRDATLIFDVVSYAEPAKVIVSLPNGTNVVTPIYGEFC